MSINQQPLKLAYLVGKNVLCAVEEGAYARLAHSPTASNEEKLRPTFVINRPNSKYFWILLYKQEGKE
jgi:hypothetical protein